MFGKLFKKNEIDAAPLRAMNTTAAKVAEAAQETAQQAAAWESRFNAAKGDDTALLSIAMDAPVIDIKCAAVMALSSEESLKAAEREFRTHDRKVHRAAKQRYEAVVAHRENNEAAKALIISAAALAAEPMIPANRLVELDRAWAALGQTHLSDNTKGEYAKHWATLTTVTRERGDKQLTINRWMAEAGEANTVLNTAALACANGVNDRHELSALDQSVEQLLASVPVQDESVTPGANVNTAKTTKTFEKLAALVASLNASLLASQQVAARLAILDELEQPHPLVTPLPLSADASDVADVAEIAKTGADAIAQSAFDPSSEIAPVAAKPAARWRQLPDMADQTMATPLNARFDEWQMNERDQRQQKHTDKKQKQTDERQASKDARVEVLSTIVAAGEAAIAEGHLAEANKHLVAIDDALSNGASSKTGGPLSQRIEVLQAEYARLKGWQHWGGGRVRDDLVLEAEALANQVTGVVANAEVVAVVDTAIAAAVADAAEAPDAVTVLQPAPETSSTKGEPNAAAIAATIAAEPAVVMGASAAGTKPPKEKRPARLPKISIKQHADAIENLRERWKECDRLGGATSRSLWQRFDGALKIAYTPVTAHLAKLKVTRQENLEVRNKLIAILDSAPLGDEGTPDFKELARALDGFQTEWRKLGPIEHTVPHKAREALLTRMRKSMARIEAPLFEARRVAQSKRDRLIERATALAADARARDVIAKVRELQAEWQREAKAMPLARNVENAVWTAFRTATDAVFTQRDAAFNARDAEFKINKSAREELIATVVALNETNSVADLKRVLIETDSAWRRAGEAPRTDAAKLDGQFRTAREAAQRLIASSAQRTWDAKCDALNAKLAICEEVENATAAENIDARYAAISALPNVWEQALAARLARAKAGITITTDLAAAVKHQEAQKLILLQLESALDVASPLAFQAARRDLKLRAMKMAMEGKATADANPSLDKLTADALAFSHLDAASRERLNTILVALRVSTHRAI